MEGGPGKGTLPHLPVDALGLHELPVTFNPFGLQLLMRTLVGRICGEGLLWRHPRDVP